MLCSVLNLAPLKLMSCEKNCVSRDLVKLVSVEALQGSKCGVVRKVMSLVA